MLALIHLSLSASAAGEAYFVDGATGKDSNSGTSASSAFATITKGLEAVASANVRVQQEVRL